MGVIRAKRTIQENSNGGTGSMVSLHAARTAAALSLLVLATAAPAGPPAPGGGCHLLKTQAAVICKAKVSCRSSAPAVAVIRPLFFHCAAGQHLPRPVTEAAIGAFKSPRYIRCCIGNNLLPMLPTAPNSD